MRIVKFLFFAWLAALVWAVAAAPAPRADGAAHNPQPAPTSCPTVEVTCPETSLLGQTITYTANISGGDANVTPTFKWNVSGSKIMSGESDSSMTVESLSEGGKVEATVEVGGYDPACSMTASCTTYVNFDPNPRKVGEYGEVSAEEEKAQLGNLAAELRNDATAQGHLICYGGRHTKLDEGLRRCDRARRYASESFHQMNRLVMLDGGFREEPATELWVVPAGGKQPQPTPTVDPGEVKPPPPPPRKSAPPRPAPKKTPKDTPPSENKR